MRAALLAAVTLIAVGLASAADGDAGTAQGARETPIVAELLSQPERFLGRPVAIYGLAVEVLDGGRRFILQDVSQMPLSVVAPAGDRVVLGSQLMVHGIVRRVNGRLEVAARDLFAVQIVAGGGCC